MIILYMHTEFSTDNFRDLRSPAPANLPVSYFNLPRLYNLAILHKSGKARLFTSDGFRCSHGHLFR